MLFFVAITGASLAASGMLWSDSARRENERELLYVGNQYREALTKYKTQVGRYPEKLDDLVEKKHLRRLYRDPMTSRTEWGLVEAPEKAGIIGVYSLAEGVPFKSGNFSEHDRGFEGTRSYQEWRFVARQ